MAGRLPKPCSKPGCPELTTGRYCENHKNQRDMRESAARRGYDSRWRRARRLYLSRHPLCVECERRGRLTPADTVDHVVPHKGDPVLLWDEANWQALCAPCHSRKTAREDGGFGNPQRAPRRG